MVNRSNNQQPAPAQQPNVNPMLAMLDSAFAREWKDSRFGQIPRGRYNVTIIDAAWVEACESSELKDEDATFKGFERKEKFNMAFNQPTLWIVFQDEQGRVLIDRSYMHSWMKATDVKAARLIQVHGLVEDEDTGYLTNPDGTKGIPETEWSIVDGRFVFKQKKSRTETCLRNLGRRFSAAGCTGPMSDAEQLIGCEVQILVDKDGEQSIVRSVVKKDYKPVTMDAESQEAADEALPELNNSLMDLPSNEDFAG